MGVKSNDKKADWESKRRKQKMTDVTKFIDKMTGNIHIGDLVIGKDLKWEDGERLAPFAKVSKSEKIFCLDMNEFLVADEVPMRVDITLFQEADYSGHKVQVELICQLPKEAYDCGIEQNYVVLDASKKWLKAVLGEPDEENDHFISYRYDWGWVAAHVGRDGRQDLRGGTIEIDYNMR